MVEIVEEENKEFCDRVYLVSYTKEMVGGVSTAPKGELIC